MRIDKFLWSVRLYKTRAVASEACGRGQVLVGEQRAKSSREVKPGDRIRIRREQIYFEYEVLDTPRSRLGAPLVKDYIRDITPAEELEKLEMMRLARQRYVNPYGEGRPTKKDRRCIEGFTEDFSQDFIQDDQTDYSSRFMQEDESRDDWDGDDF